MDADITLDQKLKVLSLNIKEVVAGHARGVAVIGPPGLGKSYQAGAEVMGMMEDEYSYAPTHTSPMAHFIYLYQNRARLIIIDDSSDDFKNPDIQAMTKALLCPNPVTKQNTVSWNTTSDRLEKLGIPSSFEFTGRLIFIGNAIPNNVHAQAIQSRMNVVHFNLTFGERKVLMERVLNQNNSLPQKQRNELLEFIFNRATPATKMFDCRLVEKSIIHVKAHPDNWQLLVEHMLDADPRYSILEQLAESKKSVENQCLEFEAQTGCKRRTFYVLRERWGLKAKLPALLHDA